MLSPARHHQSVPKDLAANLRFRRNLRRLAASSAAARAAILRACADDLLFYVNSFVWQTNPQKRGEEVGPFISWDFQDAAFRTIVDSIECDCDGRKTHGHNLVIEKSREVGASWQCLIVLEWLWHFHRDRQLLMISRSEEAAESFSMNSLTAKIDFIHKHLPGWLKPNMVRRSSYYGNTDTGSEIAIEASTGRTGVGGRATAIFVDEFSQIREGFEVLQRTSDTSSCRIFNFTHTDTANAAAEVARRAHKGEMRLLQLHWTMHPEKKRGLYRVTDGKLEILDKSYPFPPDYRFVMDGSPTGGYAPGLRSPAYDQAELDKGSRRAMAQDWDIDIAGSMRQFFDPVKIRVLTETTARAPDWQGELDHDRDSGQPLGLVSTPGGSLRLWLRPDMHGKLPLAPYVMGCDVSAGTGATNSCVSVANALTGQKVAELATPHIEPTPLAPLVAAIGRLFADSNGEPALLAWETPGPGQIFGKALMEQCGYSNVYYRENETKTRWAKQTKDSRETPGWFSNPSTKRNLLEDYRAALDRRLFTNPSEEALAETLEFRYGAGGKVEHAGEEGGTDPSGARGNHGDRVIADALAWKMCRRLGQTSAVTAEKEQLTPGSLAWRRQLATRDNKTDPWGEGTGLHKQPATW